MKNLIQKINDGKINSTEELELIENWVTENLNSFSFDLSGDEKKLILNHLLKNHVNIDHSKTQNPSKITTPLTIGIIYFKGGFPNIV